MSNSLKEKLTQRLEKQIAQQSVTIGVTSASPNHIKVEEPKDNLIVLDSKKDEITVTQPLEHTNSKLVAIERHKLLKSFVRDSMIEGVDYGLIPGFAKPTLLKSGGEKLANLFQLSSRVDILNCVEDWQLGFFHYQIKVTLISKGTGSIEAEGIGCCNSRERKFKNQDPYNVLNNLVKIGIKRAFIDAILRATGASSYFSQDVEDLTDDSNSTNKEVTIMPVSNAPTSQNTKREQLQRIFELVELKGLPIDKMKALLQNRYRVLESKSLTEAQADDLIALLEAYNAI